MKVHYFFRENIGFLSIEKLFAFLIPVFEKNGITAVKVTNPFPFTLVGVVKAMLYFRKRQGDINHITGDFHWVSLLLDPKKTILTIHDLVGGEQTSGFKKRIYQWFWVKLPCAKLQYITVISEKTKRDILAISPNAASKIRVIPNCLTIAEKHNLEENNIDSGINVLIVGTRYNKNIERTLQALHDLPVHITIIGKLDASQQNIIDSLQLTINNKIDISEEEVLQHYSQSHILCFASLYEGFGLPILEAQAQNCCVITSNISPMKEVAGDAALLVDPYNVSEIRNAVQKLVEDQNLRKSLIKKGKSNIQSYKVEKVVAQYIDLYEKIKQNNNHF